MTDMPSAPTELLISIKCTCKVNIRFSCSCSKKRLPCTVHCIRRGECNNSANTDGYIKNHDDDEEEEDFENV